MKTLFSLLLIVSITIISWSTFAKSNLIQVNTLYIQSSSTSESMVLKPSLSTRTVNENIALSSNNSKYNITNRNFIFNVRLKKLLTTMDTLQYTTERDAEFNIFFNKALELYDNFITDEEKKIFIAKRKSVMLIDTILMLEWVYDDPTINDNGFNISFNHPIIFLIYKNGVIEKKWYVGYYDNLDICIRYMLHMNAGDKIEFRIKKLLHEIPIRVKKYSMILFQEFITNY